MKKFEVFSAFDEKELKTTINEWLDLYGDTITIDNVAFVALRGKFYFTIFFTAIK